MERGVVAFGALLTITWAVLTAGCGGSTRTETVTVAGPAKSGVAAPRQILEFGYIKSLTRKGSRFEMRFDPAWFVSGVTANIAAAEDGVVDPGQPVPNDNYVIDESHRLLTYLVPANAHVTVLTKRGDPTRLGATPISVSQLAQILHGTSPIVLSEPVTTGFWIAVRIDTVRSLDQQYRP